MSDGVQLNPGDGGDIAAADEIAGQKYQRVKIVLGADGFNDGDVSSGNRMPITGTVAVSNFPASVDVSGSSVSANTGLAQPLTDAQLRATPVPVSGTVSTGLTQPLTDTQLRATPVPVSGTFWQTTQPVSGTVTVGDGTNNINVATSTADATADALNRVRTITANMVFNGATWDRLRGDTTSGAWVNVKNASIAVTGTFWQSTQPVSGTVAVTTVKPDGTNTQPSMDAAARRGYVQLTDGTTAYSAAAPVPVQVTNTARTELRFYAVGAASGTTGTETAITLTKSSGTSATTTGTSFVVTSGKRFKITSITFASQGNSTGTVQTTLFSLRINTGGAVTTTSTPIILRGKTSTPATSLAWDRFTIPLPADGLEIPGDGTLQFGVTANAVFTTNAPTWDVYITGYEY